MKVWIYGDSFCEWSCAYGHSDIAEKKIWYQIVRRHFGDDSPPTAQQWALGGTSLDYTYMKVAETHNKWKPDDIIIVGLTHWRRYINDIQHPRQSGLTDWAREHFTKKEIEHLKYFYAFLHRYNECMARLQNFIDSLAYKAITKNVKIVVLRAFEQPYITRPELIDSKGDLFTICKNEKSPPYQTEHRSCHLSWVNHGILANNIISAIRNNTEVDLTPSLYSKKEQKPSAEFIKMGYHEHMTNHPWIEGYDKGP